MVVRRGGDGGTARDDERDDGDDDARATSAPVRAQAIATGCCGNECGVVSHNGTDRRSEPTQRLPVPRSPPCEPSVSGGFSDRLGLGTVLRAVQLRVHAVAGQQPVVRAFFDDPSVVDDENAVG